MRTTWEIAWTEAKMSRRGWRFWLLFGLIILVSLSARHDYLAHMDDGYYLSPAFSFVHAGFALIFLITLLGAVAVAFDICARLRRNRMDQILFPLPVHPVSIILGRFTAVLMIIVPLSMLGTASLGGWLYLYGHSSTVWQPFVIAYLLLLLPLLLPVAAMAVMLRTIIPHDFAAMLAGILLASVLYYFGSEYHLLLSVPTIWHQIENASPALGVMIHPLDYVWPLAFHLALTLFFLSLAPLYMRRQEPQRSIIQRTKRHSIFALPTLWRLITNLRFDRQVGIGYALILLSTAALAGLGGMAYQAGQANGPLARWNEVAVATRAEQTAESDVDLQQVEIAVLPNAQHDSAQFNAHLHFTAQHWGPLMAFRLDEPFAIDAIQWQEEPVEYERFGDVLFVQIPSALQSRSEAVFQFRYHGRSERFYSDYAELTGDWLPLPWNRTRSESGWVEQADDFFTAEITLRLDNNQRAVIPGERISQERSGGQRIEIWQTFQPAARLQLYWGAFEVQTLEKPGYEIAFYHLPNHDYHAAVYLEEVNDQEDYVREHLGAYPLPRLTLVETPYQQTASIWDVVLRREENRFHHWTPELSERMPGMMRVPENHLTYLHERIWDLERLDLDPRAVPFYQQLRTVLRHVNDRFYQGLIRGYYVETLNPTGRLAFWIRDYLSSYAGKLLDQNPWRQRSSLNYDMGHESHLPLSLAQTATLYELHQNPAHREMERIRGEGLFRMIHHLLDDDAWWALQKEMFAEYRFKPLPVESFLQLVEQHYGEPLDWLWEDWLYGAALPEYEITLAEAQIKESQDSFVLRYDVLIRVQNHGTGRMKVPIFLETEMDYVFRDVWLGSGDQAELRLTVPHRPVFAMVDPQNWLIQLPFYDEQKGRRLHSEKKVTIRGEETSESSGIRSL